MENPRSRDLLKSQSSSRAASEKNIHRAPVQLFSCVMYTHAFPRLSCFAETHFPWISEIRVWSAIRVTCYFVFDFGIEEL